MDIFPPQLPLHARLPPPPASFLLQTSRLVVTVLPPPAKSGGACFKRQRIVNLEEMSCDFATALEATPCDLHPNPFSALLFTPHCPVLPAPALKTRPTTPPPSLKQDILQWFQNLPARDKVACSTIDDPLFVQPFLALLPHPQHLYHLPSRRQLKTTPTPPDPFFLQLVEDLRVAWVGSPQLYLPCAEKLSGGVLGWLEGVSGRRVFEWAQRGRGGDNLLWFSPQSFHSLPAWLASELEKTIVRHYLGRERQKYYLEEFGGFLRGRGRVGEGRALAMAVGEEVEPAVRERVREEEERFLEGRQMALLREEPEKKRRKRRNPHKEGKKNLEAIQLSTSSSEVAKENTPQLPIPTPQLHLQDKVEANTLQPLDQNGRNLKQTHTQPHQGKFKAKSIDSPSPARREAQQNHNPHPTPQPLKDNPPQPQTPSQPTKRRRRRCRKQQQAFTEAAHTLWGRHLTKHLQTLVDDLGTATNSLYESKVIAFERLRYFCQLLFPTSSTVLFGSAATGLALPNSDVDILLVGLPCREVEGARGYLAQLAGQIEAMGWVVGCASYLHARVPVVKLEVDMSIPFLQTKHSHHQFAIYDPSALDCLNLPNPSSSHLIRIDISIAVGEGSHGGLQTTHMMRVWMQRYPGLQRVLVLFKYFLQVRGYNCNFGGGVGSYGVFLMVAAYLKEYQARETDLGRLFVGLLEWYGVGFDNLTRAVRLVEQGSCFPPIGEVTDERFRENLLQLIDPLTGGVLSGSRELFEHIRADCKEVAGLLRGEEGVIAGRLREGVGSVGELGRLMGGRRAVERWLGRVEGGRIVEAVRGN